MAEEKSDFAMKIVVLGPAKGGKSTFIDSFISEEVTDMRKSYYPIFQTKVVKAGKKCYTMNIWDSGAPSSVSGSSQIVDVNKIYYRDAHVVLLAYDPTLIETAPSTVEGWLKELSQNISDRSEIIVLGTKADLLDKQKAQESQKKIEMSCKIRGLRHMLVSSKTREGYEELLAYLKSRCQYFEGKGLNDVTSSSKAEKLSKKTVDGKVSVRQTKKGCC